MRILYTKKLRADYIQYTYCSKWGTAMGTGDTSSHSMATAAYLLTYLLTYSMEQSPSWEANWFCS